ncbi:ribosome biogenesis GTP-binding protein YihA/YsxC [Pseudorhodoplanes sp.]|uniref:ribosome biogenesis GTP-binding protein YihA/YsxC n=1 Tax=Pseudorhodoplanes sp. TaxID=1934341 RepID=UPI002B6ABA35|nr:ribosome biogenesis GTP-binding protein YihA/YsxC [Pseudorhodoplanes sp.]HWV55278.1 ribosome biogenesis GTP-binding protein YihA/YsxC [Pseudorhodoplanes sp.]
MSDFTRSEIEAGRKLFAGDWQFMWAAASVGTLPPMKGMEIAFAGRSNAGKSSLINAVTGRKALARTSHTPGRTQEIIFFQGPDNLRLADMPGYGYAEAPKAKVKAWTEMIHAYLQGRANLARVYVLIDARHGIKEADKPALELLRTSAVSHQIVLTKCDQLSARDLAQRIEEVGQEMGKNAAAFPEILATSSREGTGIPELRATIARLVAERR